MDDHSEGSGALQHTACSLGLLFAGEAGWPGAPRRAGGDRSLTLLSSWRTTAPTTVGWIAYKGSLGDSCSLGRGACCGATQWLMGLLTAALTGPRYWSRDNHCLVMGGTAMAPCKGRHCLLEYKITVWPSASHFPSWASENNGVYVHGVIVRTKGSQAHEVLRTVSGS